MYEHARTDIDGVPLACLDDDGVLVDATAMTNHEWSLIHRVTPRPLLTCRFCSRQMQAKRSKTGLAFFAHDRRSPSCPSTGETAEHRYLKTAIAQATRAEGWLAELEAAGDGWRADVLVTSPSGDRRIAFEVQLAAMTVAEGRRRTDRYHESDVETVWATTRLPAWFFELPGIQIATIDDELQVTRGCLRRNEYSWDRPAAFALQRFLRHLFAGNLICAQPDWHHDEIPRGSSTISRSFVKPTAWVKPGDWDRELADRRRRQEEQAAEEHQRRLHAQRIQDLLDRQLQLTPIVVDLACERTGLQAWAGERTGPDGAPQPSRRYAAGVPVFVGQRHAPVLWAVVCPVADRLGNWARWKWRAATVFVASTNEERRINTALHHEVRVQLIESHQQATNSTSADATQFESTVKANMQH